MSGRFVARQTPLAGLLVLERRKMVDERGYLTRLFCADDLAAYGWNGPIAQLNETATRSAGTLRGMHYQRPPHAEMKLVTCTRGRVHDVVVDVRPASLTYLRHFGIELSDDNAVSLLIPEGFAHGFQTLSDDVRMIYAHSRRHEAGSEAGLDATDPALAIAWPLPVASRSDRDRAHPRLAAHPEAAS